MSNIIGELFDMACENIHKAFERMPPYQPSSDTSRAAAVSMRGIADGQEREVYYWFVQRGEMGANYDEACGATGISPQAMSARINALKRKGKLEDAGRRSKTRTGRSAAVYKAVIL